MTAYNAREEAQAQKLARQRQEPDADGFVTVTRGGRNAAARMGDAKEVLERQREKRRKNEEAADFYRFQGRERRKERAEELVRKFEEDKERVRGMRAVRGSFRVSLNFVVQLEDGTNADDSPSRDHTTPH